MFQAGELLFLLYANICDAILKRAKEYAVFKAEETSKEMMRGMAGERFAHNISLPPSAF